MGYTKKSKILGQKVPEKYLYKIHDFFLEDTWNIFYLSLKTILKKSLFGTGKIFLRHPLFFWKSFVFKNILENSL